MFFRHMIAVIRNIGKKGILGWRSGDFIKIEGVLIYTIGIVIGF